jgi:hypothetical protein
MAKRFRDLRKGDKLYVCPTEYDIRSNHDLEIESFTIDHTEYWHPDKSVFAMYIKSDKTGMESATSVDTKDENLTHHWYTYTSLSECKEAYRKCCKEILTELRSNVADAQSEVNRVEQIMSKYGY